jgi:predicted GIY-YIG superfamily endonuclease
MPGMNPHSKARRFWLYVLRLEKNKYFVGITSKSPEERIRQHVAGAMAVRWTRRYKPLKVMERKYLGTVTLAEAERYENKLVRSYMDTYGYNNVRGGDLTYEDDYVKRFGQYFTRFDWRAVAVILLLSAVVLFFLVDKILR